MVRSQSDSLIDINIYLASLVSDTHAVDPLLDEVRAITAAQPSELSEKQIDTLTRVRRGLESYLITEEKARSFTAESLQAQIDYHFKGNNVRRANRNLALALASAIAITVLVGLTVPFPDGQSPKGIMAAGFAVLHINAAMLFMSALHAFSPRLRAAFAWICVGIIILGISVAMELVWVILGVKYGSSITVFATLLPVVLASTAFYIGATRLASLIAESSRLRTSAVGITTALVAAIAGLSTLAFSSEPIFAIAVAFHASLITLLIASCIDLWAGLRTMTELYQKPIGALLFSVSIATLITLGTLVRRVVYHTLPVAPLPYTIGVFLLIIVLGCALLRAGYIFNKASRY